MTVWHHPQSRHAGATTRTRRNRQQAPSSYRATDPSDRAKSSSATGPAATRAERARRLSSATVALSTATMSEDLPATTSAFPREPGSCYRCSAPSMATGPFCRLGPVPHQFSGGLGNKAVARVIRDPEEVGPPAGVLDGEQDVQPLDVQPLEEHRVDDEENGSQDALGLGSQEPGPSRALARCRPKAVVAEDASDRRRPDPDAELSQLALDAYATSRTVLRCGCWSSSLHVTRELRSSKTTTVLMPS